jgi:hypothetical protein
VLRVLIANNEDTVLPADSLHRRKLHVISTSSIFSSVTTFLTTLSVVDDGTILLRTLQLSHNLFTEERVFIPLVCICAARDIVEAFDVWLLGFRSRVLKELV